MRTIMTVQAFRAKETQEQFMHEDRAIEGVARSFERHSSACQSPKILVDQRDQLVQSILISIEPALKKWGDMPRFGYRHDIRWPLTSDP